MGNAWTHFALSTRDHWGNSVDEGSFLYSAVCTGCGLSSGGLSRPLAKTGDAVGLSDALAHAVDDGRSRVFSLGNGGALALAPLTRLDDSSCTHDQAFLYIYEAVQSIQGQHSVKHDADFDAESPAVKRSNASFGVRCGSECASGLVCDQLDTTLEDARLVLRPGWGRLVDLLFVHTIDMDVVRQYINAEACRLIAITRQGLGDALESAASTFFVDRSTLFNLD